MPSSSTLSSSLPTGTRRHPAYTHSQASVSFCFVRQRQCQALSTFPSLSQHCQQCPALPAMPVSSPIFPFSPPCLLRGRFEEWAVRGLPEKQRPQVCHGLGFLSASAASGCHLPGAAEQASVWMGTCWWLWARQVALFIHSCCPQPWP